MKLNPHFQSFVYHLGKNKINTAINVFGFAISLMFVVLISLYVQIETNVDNYTKSERIYRMEHAEGMKFSPVAAISIQNTFPEVESTLRIYPGQKDQVYSPITDEIYLKPYWYTDSTIFDFFDFEFVEGDPKNALQSAESVVISENLANIIFNNEPAIGKRIKSSVKSNDYMIVTGVVKYLENSHFNRVDIIKPRSAFQKELDLFNEKVDDIKGPKVYTYIMTKAGTSLDGKEAEVLNCIRKTGDPKFTEVATQVVSLTPLRQAYFHNEKDTGYEFRSNEYTFITILSITALMILLFAIINYINLSVAQSSFRAKEVATRQIFGESKSRVVLRFIMESVAMCGISAVIGIGLAYLVQDYFNGIMNCDISMLREASVLNVVLLLVTILLIGVVSGVVPAGVIVRYNAIDVVRGTLKRKTKMIFSKVLITFQYAITIVLIGCTITISRQLTYMQSYELGFTSEYLIEMDNPVGMSGQDKLKSDLMQISGVKQVSFARSSPLSKDYYTRNDTKWKTSDGTEVDVYRFVGDSAFLTTLGFEIVYNTGIEDKNAEWLNETAWRKLGLAPDATEVKINDSTFIALKGRIRDFHYEDYAKPIGAVSIGDLNVAGAERGYHIFVKVSQASPYQTMEQVKNVVNAIHGIDVFDGEFLDKQIAAQYDKQRQTIEIIGMLSFAAIVLAALGILAMATYFTRQRRSEAAVRKVFGSTTLQLLIRFIASFMKNIVVAYIIALPIIYQLMEQWLSQYVYKISLSWTIFAYSGLIVFLVAAIMVFYQSYKTSLTNPVETLKS